MIRSELVARIAERNPHLFAYGTQKVVDAILGRLEEALTAGDRVELRGFAAFSVLEAPPRHGRNPRTGQIVEIEIKAKVRFRSTKAMNALLNRTTPATASVR